MNGTGVLKVYLIQARKYAYCLHFLRAIAPHWVLQSLKDMSKEMKIVFEDKSQDFDTEILENIPDEQITHDKHDQDLEYTDEDDEVQIIGDHKQKQVMMPSIKLMEDIWNDASVKTEKNKQESVKEGEEKHSTSGIVTRSTIRVICNEIR
jgi:hypothetical protein